MLVLPMPKVDQSGQVLVAISPGSGIIDPTKTKKETKMNLLSTGNPKVLKGMAQGYNTYILHLAPADLSGYETCAKRTAGCTAA